MRGMKRPARRDDLLRPISVIRSPASDDDGQQKMRKRAAQVSERADLRRVKRCQLGR